MGRNKKLSASLADRQLRERIGELVCSEPWLEVCSAELIDSDPGRRRPAKRLDRKGIYPPGGRHLTKMVHCSACGKRWYPPNYVGQDLCLDCAAGQDVPLTDERTHVTSTSSPTAIAFRQMELYHIRLIEPQLAAEDEASLRKQIAEYSAGHKNASG